MSENPRRILANLLRWQDAVSDQPADHRSADRQNIGRLVEYSLDLGRIAKGLVMVEQRLGAIEVQPALGYGDSRIGGMPAERL